jgi:hypothetical protein
MKKPRLPKNADFSQLARAVVEAATNETDDPPESAAVLRGRKGGAKGGKARAKKLSKSRRTEIARKAARSRWSKKTQ